MTLLILTSWENQFMGFLGSGIAILKILHDYVKVSLQTNKPLKIKRYSFVLFLIIIICGQILVAIQEYVFEAYDAYKGTNSSINYYIDHMELISFIVGVFSLAIMAYTIKFGNKKIGDG